MKKIGKIAVVTGANKGLGKEIGRQLGALGYTVVLTSRNLQSGEKAKLELVSAGYDAHTAVLEVTSASSISAFVSYLEEKFGKVDILVNNAGVSLEWDGTPTNVDKVRRTLEVNLIAPFAITEALVPLLSRSDDARVINHSSQLGSIDTASSKWEHVQGFMAVGYSTSKAALNMLTVIQSKTLASKKIAVTAAHPGWVRTDLGTEAAPMDVAEGARTVVDLVTVTREDFPDGQLVHLGKIIPW